MSKGQPMRLISANDVFGHMAMWAVKQHPFHEPPDLFEVCKSIREAAVKDFPDGAPSLPMRWFEDARDLSHWLQTALAGHPTLLLWNTPRSGHNQQYVFSSRYGGPAPEHDFIDIDALLGNVARGVWKEAEEFEKAA
jgi:hypothetical protein